MKKSKKLLISIVLFSAILMFSMSFVTASMVNSPQAYTIADDNVEIEVKYKKSSTIKVNFNGNGGKIGSRTVVTNDIKKGNRIGKLPTTPKRSGYTFNGWFTQKNGGNKINANTIPKSKVTYFAQWKAKSFTLTMDANGGTVNPKSKKVESNKAIGTLATPTRSGYTFTGWFTRKTGGTKVSSTTKMPNKNMVIYAQWTKTGDPRLGGIWDHVEILDTRKYKGDDGGGGTRRYSVQCEYIFEDSGLFSHNYWKDDLNDPPWGDKAIGANLRGKYTASNGKITFTITEHDGKKRNDAVVLDYQISKQGGADYLTIKPIYQTETYTIKKTIIPQHLLY